MSRVVNPKIIYAGGGVVIAALLIAVIVLATATPKPAYRMAQGSIPHNMRMARENAITHNMHMAQMEHQKAIANQHRTPPVRLNMAPAHAPPPPPLPSVREQHNMNVRFGHSREPLRNMMASDNEGAHLSTAIWNRESLIRKHKVIS